MNHRFGTVAPFILALSLLLDAVCFADTPGPARLIKDINQTASFGSGSFPKGFVDIGGTTLFVATLQATGSELIEPFAVISDSRINCLKTEIFCTGDRTNRKQS